MIKNKPIHILIAIFSTLVTTLIQILISLLQKIFLGIIDIVLLFLFFWKILHYPIAKTIIIVILIETVLILLSNIKLYIESIQTEYFSVLDGFRFQQIITQNSKDKERPHTSPRITINKEQYIVIEYGDYINPNRSENVTGFLILDHKTGRIIRNENELKDVIKVYKCWRYIYLNPLLGKKIKLSPQIIKSMLKFQNNFVSLINKRISNNYKEVSTIEDEELINMLKELDQQVILQYQYVKEKLEREYKLLKAITIIHSNPSLEFYQEIINDINIVSKMSQEENKIWQERQKTWRKLYKYEKIKIEKLPEPNYKSISLGIIGDLINYFLFKKEEYPISKDTMIELTMEGSKKTKKELMKLLNKYVTYHFFGIKAIEKNIELNNELKKIRDTYNQIWSYNDISNVRN
ncbi:TPA: hypothetical protein HA371_07705 [Candidatus Woesearchaeota archaeon]|nr:hypothetical protein [Candidatus Woesearchaeota archaeon]HIJ14598.1 hypothetical protein [Candidatus Woesearchaeota archaeon]